MICYLCKKNILGYVKELKNHFIDIHRTPLTNSNSNFFFQRNEGNCNLVYSSFKSFARHLKSNHISSILNINSNGIEIQADYEFVPEPELEFPCDDNIVRNTFSESDICFYINRFFSELRCNTSISESTILVFWEKCSTLVGIISNYLKEFIK